MHVFKSTNRLSQIKSRQCPVTADLGLIAVQVLLQQGPQILPTQVLHLVVQSAVVLKGAVESNNTRMIQLVQGLS